MILPLIEKHLIDKKRLDIEHKDTFYVTQASCNRIINKKTGLTKLVGCCPRAAYYSCIGMPENSANRNRELSRKLGDYTEYMLLNVIKDIGILYDKAVKFTIEDISVNGKLDAIVEIDNEKVGIEIKSLSSNKWTNNHIFGSKWDKPTPKINHLIQCMVYLYAYLGEINNFVLFYIRRDNGDCIEFNIELVLIDGKLYPSINGEVDYTLNCDDIINNFKILKELLDNDIIPMRGFHIEYTPEYAKELYLSGFLTKFMYEKFNEAPFGDFECRGCGFIDICIKDGE
jgi:hypothetical protein